MHIAKSAGKRFGSRIVSQNQYNIVTAIVSALELTHSRAVQYVSVYGAPTIKKRVRTRVDVDGKVKNEGRKKKTF